MQSRLKAEKASGTVEKVAAGTGLARKLTEGPTSKLTSAMFTQEKVGKQAFLCYGDSGLSLLSADYIPHLALWVLRDVHTQNWLPHPRLSSERRYFPETPLSLNSGMYIEL